MSSPAHNGFPANYAFDPDYTVERLLSHADISQALYAWFASDAANKFSDCCQYTSVEGQTLMAADELVKGLIQWGNEDDGDSATPVTLPIATRTDNNGDGILDRTLIDKAYRVLLSKTSALIAHAKKLAPACIRLWHTYATKEV